MFEDHLVRRHQAFLRIADEHEPIGLLEGAAEVVLHRCGHTLMFRKLKSARIHQRQPNTPPLDRAVEPITRRPSRRSDDGFAPPHEAVEQRGFSHVGPPDNGNDRTLAEQTCGVHGVGPELAASS
ncbi:MAG: hypothetical protein HYS71_04375 [Candidatus Omnitrophica bacterium]|nr:hypothetical protein [Candidatus Omnitrophota bacterium]